MTTWRRDFQARAAVGTARATRALRGRQRDEGPLRTLLLPPSHTGSLGDEAMMSVCTDELARQRHLVGIVDFVEGDRWPNEPPETEHLDLSGFFGSSYLRSLPGVAATLRQYDQLWCLGADVLDGHYSPVVAFRRVNLLRIAAELGLEVSVLGFSFNAEPSPLVLSALRDLPSSVRLCARDPISHARLTQNLGRPVELVADLAFGLEPEGAENDDEAALLGWIAARRADGHIVLGFNASHRAFKSTVGADIDDIVAAYASALTGIFREREDVSIVAIPHDYRETPQEMSDDNLLAAIADRLEPQDRARFARPSFRLQARFVSRLTTQVDAVFSGRMHLVIAALRNGTPAATIAYQGKVVGLSQYFDLPELGVPPSVALDPGGIRRAIEALIEHRDDLAARIARAQPAVAAMQARNFSTRYPTSVAPRLLVITPEATHPTNKGNRARIADLCERAGGLGWEVHLAHIEQTRGDREAMLEHWGAAYHPIPYHYPPSLQARAARRLRGALTSDYELAIDDWYDEEVDTYLEALQQKYAFDAVMVEYAHQSRAFEVFGPDVLKILDTHDSLAHRFARQRKLGLRRTGFSTTPEEEAIAFSRADVVLAIQDLEREEFQSRSEREVVTVGHRVFVLDHLPREPRENRLLFLGSRNQANVDGIQFFLEEVWPHVSGDVKLLVAGPVCDVVDIPPGVQTMPVVDDVAAAYDQANIAIVPNRFGTGLKIKAIEAMGRGMATVSTRIGAEGLEEAHGNGLVIGDTADELVRAIQALLRDNSERRAVANRALEFARAWNAGSERAFAAVLAKSGAVQAAD
ncbi:MAG: glycosyltransferase [Deltaproteobacteria bacterium]|nr:glycosyltransferase [Deltaproteobacteria bacterium]